MSYNMNFKIGNDNGNSEHDIIINNELICQPNVISKIRKAPNVEEINNDYFIKNIENNLIVDIISNEVNTATYLCGTYSLKSGQTVRTINIGYDNDKASNEIVIINTLAQIAGHAVKVAYMKSELSEDTDIKVKVDMSTSLPIRQYTKKKAQEFANRFMNGKHIVNVTTPLRKIPVEIEFEYVKVIPEGVTTVFALTNADDELFESYNKNHEVKIDKSFFENKKILHIAIGEGTTELPVTEGRAFNPNFIKGSNNGLGHVINKSLDEFKEECGQTNMSRQKYSEILKKENHKFHQLAKEIIEIPLEEQTDEIFEDAKTEIDRANNEIDIIAVYGGGSILMRDSLEPKLEKICNTGKIILFYVDKKHAVTLESKGLDAFTKSKIFEQVKKIEKSKVK